MMSVVPRRGRCCNTRNSEGESQHVVNLLEHLYLHLLEVSFLGSVAQRKAVLPNIYQISVVSTDRGFPDVFIREPVFSQEFTFVHRP